MSNVSISDSRGSTRMSDLLQKRSMSRSSISVKGRVSVSNPTAALKK